MLTNIISASAHARPKSIRWVSHDICLRINMFEAGRPYVCLLSSEGPTNSLVRLDFQRLIWIIKTVWKTASCVSHMIIVIIVYKIHNKLTH